MDNFDVFILNGKKFRPGSRETYDINLLNIENFIKENLNSMPKMLPFCDRLYFFAKKTTVHQAEKLFELVSTLDKSDYLVRSLITIIQNVEDEDIEYRYLTKFCETSLVRINTERSAECSARFKLLSDEIIDLYGNHIYNAHVFDHVITNFVVNYQIVKKIVNKIEFAVGSERNRQYVVRTYEKILCNFTLNDNMGNMCCDLLYIVRNYQTDVDVRNMMQVGLKRHKKIKVMVQKITDGIFNVRQDLLNELNSIKNNDNDKMYYSNILLKIIEIYESSNNQVLKKCCAYELADYVYSNALWMKGFYMQHSDKSIKIITDENVKMLYTQ